MVIVSGGWFGRLFRPARGPLLAVAVSVGLLAALAPPAAAQPARIKVIVRLQAGGDVDTQVRRATAEGARTRFLYRNVIRGFAVEVPEQAVAALRRIPQVVSVEVDGEVRASATPSSATQTSAPWGLDRIDQTGLPLDRSYTYPNNGGGVTAYVIDTGILASHTDFGGRVQGGFSAISDGRGTTDCNGHGTHVAGTVGGSTYGVAKGVTLVPVRVLDCGGSGSYSGVIAGLDWVAGQHGPGAPAVANLSLGGSVSSSVDTAVQNLVTDGVTVAVAAGNSNKSACEQSPARVPAALTVAASTATDARASFSNFGSCTDVFAPGQDIMSDWSTSSTATNTISGTSMAAPHVAGAAALVLAQQNGLSPAEVATRLLAAATPNVVANAGSGSPNKLLRVADGAVALPLAVTNPGNQTGTVGVAASLTMTVADGSGSYTWSATGLPAGLSINAASGVITGSPTAAGVSTATVTARDAGGLTGSTSFSWTIGAAPAGCAAGGQKLANPGFEEGATGWTGTAGVIGQPTTAPLPRTGPGNARLGGTGVKGMTTLTQQVAIPTGCTGYRLTYWLRVDSTETSSILKQDKLTVTLGSSTVGSFSNANKGSSYVERTVSITGQAGKTVPLTFTATEDKGKPTTFSIDDTAFTAS